MFAKVAVLCLVAVASAQQGFLVVKKSVDSSTGYFGPNQNFTVTIDIHNIGDGSAFDVEVADPWSEESFTLGGAFEHTYQEIKAGEVESFTFQVAPLAVGEQAGFAAQYRYQPFAEPLEEPQTGSSNTAAGFEVLEQAAYAKLTASHTVEMSIFTVALFLTIAVPLLQWSDIQNTHTSGIPNVAFQRKGKKTQ
jgi:hypothetical protein